MKLIYSILLSLALSSNAAFAGNGSGNVSNVVQFGGSPTNNVANGPYSVSSSDITKWYTASCSNGGSNVTAGDYYRCSKMSGTSGSDWTVSATNSAHCAGFWVRTNTTASSAVGFGYGTVAVTANGSSAPTGNKSYTVTGVTANYDFGNAASTDKANFVPMPVCFSGKDAGAIIFPYLYVVAGGSSTLGIQFLCTEDTVSCP